jgi:hypothetical protein
MPNKGWFSEWLEGAQTGSNSAGTFAGLTGVQEYEQRKETHKRPSEIPSQRQS